MVEALLITGAVIGILFHHFFGDHEPEEIEEPPCVECPIEER